MVKWQRDPKIIEKNHDRLSQQSKHKKIKQEITTIHEQQRFLNLTPEPYVLAIELHKKNIHKTYQINANKKQILGFFRRAMTDEGEEKKESMRLKLFFSTPEKARAFQNDLHGIGINKDDIKKKEALRFVIGQNNDNNVRILRILHAHASFSKKMQNDIVHWYFNEDQSLLAEQFRRAVFEDATVNTPNVVTPQK